MWANNETGNIYPVQAIGERCQERGVPLLCDGVQALGKLPLHLKDRPMDYLAASAHKFHGPKGVGLLYSREGLELAPLIRGGRQERGHRAGTENLPGIGAMARAFELVEGEREVQVQRIAALRDRLQTGILQLFPGAQVLGDPEHRLPGTLNVHLPGVPGDLALVQLDRAGVAISIGAACESGSVDPSHVLLAMGLAEAAAASGLRFSLARDNTPEEVEAVLKIMAEVIKPLVN
jgi:cysteine desulfurase